MAIAIREPCFSRRPHRGAPAQGGGPDSAPAPRETIHPEVVTGDLLDEPVEAIVNAWNRNIIPWWLLLPRGISGAIKRRAGFQPLWERARRGPIPLGHAVLMAVGRTPFRGIIHVPGITMLWRTSEDPIRNSMRDAMGMVVREGFTAGAYPVIGPGSGGFHRSAAREIMRGELARIESAAKAIVVESGRTPRWRKRLAP